MVYLTVVYDVIVEYKAVVEVDVGSQVHLEIFVDTLTSR